MSETYPSLHGLQSWIQQALMFPPQASEEQTEQMVEASSRLSGTQRLAIYQRSYHMRLLQCMREQFPALCHALGTQLFTDFAREYLQTYPSVSYTLHDLGRRFPAYLEETRPDRNEPAGNRESWIDFMVDLARFERELMVMFDAPGHEGKPFAREEMPDSQLRLQPCLALGDYRFPVEWYYHEVQTDNDPSFPPQQRSLVALVRKDYFTHTFSLSAPQYVFLKALQGGKTVAQGLAIAAEEAGQPIERVYRSWAQPGSTRARWIQAGFFIATD
ncbi:HvfC/BufC family peptide modification chaperone [Candidatus Entotheonella palauensis]|uniref:HvfC/BufC family peptide modification chaperone n=1 Tax=Candidatus Entotheonella palauensis TaxID=93172 RepID=UPI000B7E0950